MSRAVVLALLFLLLFASPAAAMDMSAGVTTLTGTTAEITVNPSTGAVTISLPTALTFTGKTVTGGTFSGPTMSGTVAGTPTISGAWTWSAAQTFPGLTLTGALAMGANAITSTGTLSAGATTLSGALAMGANAITSTGTLGAGATTLSGALGMGANAITGTGAITPNANDGGALGSASLSYSDLFLANGGEIRFGTQVTITASLDRISFNSAGLTTGLLLPSGNNSVDLGDSSTAWRSLYLGTSLLFGASGNIQFNGVLADSGTAPTVSGFGTSPSVPNANGTIAFAINVGTGGTASTGTITLSPAATTGWKVHCEDVTTPTNGITKQTGGTTTTATLTNYDWAGVAVAWVASDILRCSARAY